MHHINELETRVNAFLARGIYSIASEPGMQQGETAYRLHMSEPIPLEFSAIIGDALHNLRSALDCAATEIARRHVGRTLTEGEERDCEFPIYATPPGLQRFFNGGNRPLLYGPQEQQAIASVQPGRGYDDQIAQGRTLTYGRAEEVRYDPLTVLNRMSNIDKHRNLNIVAWWSDLVYWGSDGPSSRRWRWGTLPFEDGTILGTLIDDPTHPEPLPQLQTDMELRILDPPGAGATDIVGLLKNMHSRITAIILPTILNP
jgi:hypothetical protein